MIYADPEVLSCDVLLCATFYGKSVSLFAKSKRADQTSDNNLPPFAETTLPAIYSLLLTLFLLLFSSYNGPTRPMGRRPYKIHFQTNILPSSLEEDTPQCFNIADYVSREASSTVM